MRGYNLLKRWEALPFTQRDWAIQWLTGCMSMMLEGFTNGHENQVEAKFFLDEFEKAIEYAAGQSPSQEINQFQMGRDSIESVDFRNERIGGMATPPEGILKVDHLIDRKPESLKSTQHGGSHYKGMAIEPAEYCQKNNLKFCESSVIKYLSRHQAKAKADDVKKAIHFCQMLLEMEYGIECEVEYPERKEHDIEKQG